MTPPTYSPWLRAFEALARLGFSGMAPAGSPGAIGPHAVPAPVPGVDWNQTLAAPASDCNGGPEWTRLASARALYRAWSPPPASPWSGFAKATLFAAADAADDPRPAPWASLPTREGRTAPARLPEGTAVVLDLPGAWSVAVAAWLARNAGLQPVVMANNWPHPRGVVPMQEMLAALLYYAPWVAEGAADRAERAAPVFVLDRDRLGARWPQPGEFDNRYCLQETDFPSPAALRRGGVQTVLYVGPSAASGTFASAPAAPARDPDGALLDAFGRPTDADEVRLERLLGQLPTPPGAAPPPEMDDLNAWLVEVRKVLGLQVAGADPAVWAIQGARDYGPAPRKTVFNTVKDPAFRGFRRAAAGGFGRLVPEPGSGAGGLAFG